MCDVIPSGWETQQRSGSHHGDISFNKWRLWRRNQVTIDRCTSLTSSVVPQGWGNLMWGKGCCPCAFFTPLFLSFCTASQRGMCRKRMGTFPRYFLPSSPHYLYFRSTWSRDSVEGEFPRCYPLLTPPHSLHSQSTSLIESVVGEDGGIPCLLPSHPLQWSAYKIKSA